ncbi:DUF2333 family protein [Rhodobaculum claviforme]|nr:DUF2333 family protein [Rhodobaculum claviforme]
MANEVIVRPQLPVPSPRRSVPALVFGTRPTTIAKRGTFYVVALVVLYFGVIGNLMHRIDTDLDFVPVNAVEGGSHAVNMAAGLIKRETVTHRWIANDPAFYPTAFLDNTPNFQRGLMRAVSRFTIELEDQVGRLRGSSAIDPDLERAAGLLQFPTDVWFFNFEEGFLPVQPADHQYRVAMRALEAYNARVAAGQAVFETRADALAAIVQRIASELGARAALTDAHLRRDNFVLDFVADDIFYFNKGVAYGNYLLIRELGRDFAALIEAQGLTSIWVQTLDSLRSAALLRPAVVLNGGGDTSVLANHLHMQGFYIKRAILQLDEVAQVIRVQR